MKEYFTTAQYQTSSVRGLVDRIVSDLASRRSVLVLVPSGIHLDSLWAAVRSRLSTLGYWTPELSLTDLQGSRSTVSSLGKALAVEWPSPEVPRTVANLVTVDDLPDVLRLGGFERLPEVARRDWSEFLGRWALASKAVADRGRLPTALCLITSADALLPCIPIPESDVYLAIHWWWGFPSALEVRTLCRLAGEGGEWDAKMRWREHILPSLAGNDLTLVEYLWDALHLSVEELTPHLRSFAWHRGWEAKTLRGWGAEALTDSSSYGHDRQTIPPVHLRTLWTHGALCWTLEYGLELHTAAMTILGRNEGVEHRLWRGQAELLLPLIDHMRLIVCTALIRSHGHDWPVRYGLPSSQEEKAAVKDSPLACQWGYLKQSLTDCLHPRSERHWLPLVRQARWIRNEIAHYRPVTFQDFEGLWQEVKRIASTG